MTRDIPNGHHVPHELLVRESPRSSLLCPRPRLPDPGTDLVRSLRAAVSRTAAQAAGLSPHSPDDTAFCDALVLIIG
jgi:hypothetical protein